MWLPVPGKPDLFVLQELQAQHVTEGVVLVLHDEGGAVGAVVLFGADFFRFIFVLHI